MYNRAAVEKPLQETAYKIAIEKDIPIPYTGKEGHGLEPVFHRDAIVLLVLSEMLVGESAEMPRGINLQDLQRLAPSTFPLIFTYHMGDSDQVRVWRIK